MALDRRQLLISSAAATLGAIGKTPSAAPAHAHFPTPGDSDTLSERLRGELTALADSIGVAGFVVGVWHDGKQVDVAGGMANLNTGAEMTPDTGWLLGSVTKILTTSLLMRAAEAGKVDLDAKVTRYLPDFRLREPGAADKIRVYQLVNHTNGMDADALMPTGVIGHGAVAHYVDKLRECGVLFEPGTAIHYSNPGFSVAGRILEIVYGEPFHQIFEREIYGTIGMTNSATSAEQAMLRPTAIGAFFDTEAGELRATKMFMLPVSGAAAGATPIVTSGDMIAFGRAHLAKGTAPNGQQLLSSESVSRMQAVTFDLDTPVAPPMGLGWWRFPIGGTTALWHGGGSPGGSSSFAVFPELDLVFVSFATGPGSAVLNDRAAEIVLDELFGRKVEAPYEVGEKPEDLGRYTGRFATHQNESQVKETSVGGQPGLEMRSRFVPMDEDHRRFMTGYTGGQLESPPASYVPLSETLFAPAGTPLETFWGFYGRMALLGAPGARDGQRPDYFHSRFRYIKRA